MKDVHFHVCPEKLCGHIWHHDRREIPEGGSRAAHTCPKCKGATDYWARFSLREAMECRRRDNGIRCGLFGEFNLAARNLGREVGHALLLPILKGLLAVLKFFGGAR